MWGSQRLRKLTRSSQKPCLRDSSYKYNIIVILSITLLFSLFFQCTPFQYITYYVYTLYIICIIDYMYNVYCTHVHASMSSYIVSYSVKEITFLKSVYRIKFNWRFSSYWNKLPSFQHTFYIPCARKKALSWLRV